MCRAHHRGEHQQVAYLEGVEAVAGHEQGDGQQTHTRGGEEARRQPSVVRRAVQQWGEDDGVLIHQSGVGRAGVRDAVRLQNQDSGLGDPQHSPDSYFVPRAALLPRAATRARQAIAEIAYRANSTTRTGRAWVAVFAAR